MGRPDLGTDVRMGFDKKSWFPPFFPNVSFPDFWDRRWTSFDVVEEGKG